MSTNPNATPFETPYALGLKQQTIIADEHAQNALNAAAIGSLDQMRFHLEHIINILEGLQGARYGDYDGNGRAENPGDGFGVRAYANEIVNHTTALSNHAQTQATMEEAQNQITAIEDQCIALFAVTSTSAATNTLKDIKTLTDQLRDGPISKLYQEAQDALVFNVGPLTNP